MARKKESLCCLQPLLLCIEKATAFIADYSVSVTGAMLMNKLVFLFFLLQDTFCLAFRLSWRVYIAAYLVTVASLFNGRIEFQRKRRFSRFFARRTQLAWPSSIVEASLPRRPYSCQHTPLHTHTRTFPGKTPIQRISLSTRLLHLHPVHIHLGFSSIWNSGSCAVFSLGLVLHPAENLFFSEALKGT